jgi:hypothetical protein
MPDMASRTVSNLPSLAETVEEVERSERAAQERAVQRKSRISGLASSDDVLADMEAKAGRGMTNPALAGLKSGRLPTIPECAAIIETEILIAHREIQDVLEGFYEELPTRLGRRGYTLSPVKSIGDDGKQFIRKLYWRRFFLRAFPKTKDGPEADPLRQSVKKKAEFEYGKKRYLRLPKSFWNYKERNQETQRKFEKFHERVINVNAKMDALYSMKKKIRGMIQSIQKNRIFKRYILP